MSGSFQGPSNLVPDKVFKMCKAAAAIADGQSLCLCPTAADGYTVALADATAVTTQIVYGVAAEAIASGAWGKVQTDGFCDYVLTDGGVTAGEMLIMTATAGTAEGAIITTANSTAFGHSITADTGNYATAVLLSCGV